eukprot:TRINITY_DN23027_c0_g1_i2.p1 TRINITY_DN23027_c0_g1~~TRINITY_DN23027_c0_g1_i2.p1  ORF type:complete len:243 (-),score=66.64 TRINITY_DN23027_c0_g1_i2:87-815(-)
MKRLESELGRLEQFTAPVARWEQYATGAHIAARMLFAADATYGDVAGAHVADLGCGCGVLAAGAALLGCAACVGVDIDPAAAAIARRNFDTLGVSDTVDVVIADVTAEPTWVATQRPRVARSPAAQAKAAPPPPRGHRGRTAGVVGDGDTRPFDTVVMNPPFGTKGTRGADMAFVTAALRLAPVVYSLHKTATRRHVVERARQLGATADVLAQLRWDIGRTYKFHKKESVDVDVDFVRFVVT